MMRQLGAVTLGGLALIPVAYAQTTPSPFRDIQFHRDLGDLAELSAPYVGELGSNVEAGNFIRRAREEIEQTLKWSGQPFYLIEVPAQFDPLTMRTVRTGAPRLIGVGSTPEVALISDARRPRLDAPSRHFGQDRTFFVVAELRHNRLVWGLMPHDAVSRTRVGAAGVLADRQLAFAQVRAEYSRVIAAAIDRCRSELRNKEQIQRIEALYEESRAREQALEQIRNKMAYDLRQAEYTEKAISRLQTIASIINVASAVNQLQAAVPELPARQLQEATTTKEALNIATVFAADKRGSVTAAEITINATGPAAIQAAQKLQTELIKAGVPPTVAMPPMH